MRALLDAGVALTSELSLYALAQRVVEIAAEVTEARYAALGVIVTAGGIGSFFRQPGSAVGRCGAPGVIDRSKTQPRGLDAS